MGAIQADVRLFISPALDTTSKGTWRVDITLNADLINAKIPLCNPLGVEEAEDIRWYLENYVSNSPLDADRANRCARLLAGYGQALFDKLRLTDAVSRLQTEGLADTTLAVEVVEECSLPDGEPDNSHSAQGILWEHLEEPALWVPWISTVVVSRRFKFHKAAIAPVARHRLELWPRPISKIDSMEKTHLYLNVLLVVARDINPEKPETGPTINLQPLIALQSEAEATDSSTSRLSLEVVRPGTYAAHRKHLQAVTNEHGKGYYHLVHLDMHGALRTMSAGKNNGSASSLPVAGIFFAQKRQGDNMDFIPARKVATLLADHGVRIVVSNACRTANALEKGFDANMAKIFLEEGIANVAAMQCEVMSGAATVFNTQLYRNFVEKGLSFSLAMREARRELRKNPTRSARFGMEIELRDWVVPVTYISDVDSAICVPSLRQKPTPPTFSSLLSATPLTSPDPKPDLIGRWRDVLAIEKDLVESRLLIIHGQAGVGKTALLRHLAGVWNATAFVQNIVYIDFAQSPRPVSVTEFIKRARGNSTFPAQQLFESNLGVLWEESIPSTAEDILQFVRQCYSRSSLLILDSLDLALSDFRDSRFRVGAFSDDQRTEFYQFIDILINYVPEKGQTKPMLIFSGRDDEHWWNNRLNNIAGRFYRLGPLDISSALTLGTCILQRAGVDTSNLEDIRSDALYRLVTLLARNPLALELVLPHAPNKKNLSEFYREIHSGSLSYSDVWKYKPSTPGADRFLLDIDTFFMKASNGVRNILRSLGLFWLEGPSIVFCAEVLCEVFTVVDDEAMYFDVHCLCLKLLEYLGAWLLDSTTQNITQVHPLLSIYLRAQAKRFVPFEKQISYTTLLSNFRRMLDRSHQILFSLYQASRLDFALLCKAYRRSLANIVTCLDQCCSDLESSSEWPTAPIINCVLFSQYAFTESVPDHVYFLEHLHPALMNFVRTYGGDANCLNPTDLTTALYMSNHLCSQYMFLTDFSLERAAQQAHFSLKLVRSSETTHPPLSASHAMFAKQMVFRLNAAISLFHKKFIEAEGYWRDQTALEQAVLGPKGLGTADVPTFLLPLAKFRQASWEELLKCAKREDSTTYLHNLRPHASQFVSETAGKLTLPMSRVEDVSKEVRLDVGSLKADPDLRSWADEVEAQLGRGAAAQVMKMQREVLIPRLQALNLTRASAVANIDFMLQYASGVPDASSGDAASYSLAKVGLECLRDMTDEECQMIDAALSVLVHNLRVERTCHSLAVSIAKDEATSRGRIEELFGLKGWPGGQQ